jgi:hypothetical protein
MIYQEKPITDTEKRPSEPQSASTTTTGGQGEKAPQPVTPSLHEQPREWLAPPFFVPTQRPYTGPGFYYYPDSGLLFNRAGPARRKSSPWPWVILTLVLVMVLGIGITFLLVPLGYSIPGFTNTVTEAPHSFTVGAHPAIVINNDVGTIHVRAGGAGSEVTIQATKHTALLSDVNATDVRFTQNRTNNIISVDVVRLSSVNLFTAPSVDIDATVPSAADLHLQTNTGGIDVTGISGQLSLSSKTGSLAATQAVLTAGSQLSTNTGSVTFEGAIGPQGSYQFVTTTGSVNVTLPASPAFHVDASSTTGSVWTDFPDLMVQHPSLTSSEMHGDVGSTPQATVTLRTNTGSVSLHRGIEGLRL